MKKKFGEFKELHVMNLSTEEFAEQDLEKMFFKYENSDEPLLLKGIGFIKFKSHEDAKKAIRELDNTLVG